MNLRIPGWIVLVVMLVVFSGCSLFESTGGTTEGSAVGAGINPQFDELYARAEAAYKEVDKLGGAWAYTGDLLKEASEHAAKKDFGKAIPLAKAVIAESEMALQQFRSQQGAGPHLF